MTGFALTLSACAQYTSSQGQSFIDPNWNGNRLTSVLVEVQNTDLRERTAIENASVISLRERGIEAIPSTQIFLPTRTYSASERKTMLKNSKISALLTITPTGKTLHRTYTPPARPYGGFGIGSGGWRGGGIGVGIDSGLLLEEPVATYRAELSELPKGIKFWVADFTTQGPTGMNFNTLGSRFAAYLVRRLSEDGMI